MRLGLGFGLHPTILGWGFGACVVVCALRLYPAVPGSGVRCGCVCLGSGFGCAPPLLAEVLGCVCVCVRVPPGPLPLLARGAVRGCVLGLGLQPRPATPGWGVGACVCLCARPACTPPLLAGVCGVGVCAWARVSAVPRHSWLGRWGVCVFVRVPRFYPALPGGVGCVCVGLGFVCSPVFSWLGCRGAWPLVCAVSVSCHLLGGPLVAWGCAGVAGVCPPPSPFFFSGCGGGWGGVVFGPVVSWLCGVRRWLPRSWVPWSPSPLPLSFGLRLRVLFFFCPSLPQRGVCWRVRGVLSSGGPLLLVGCHRFWLGGPPVFLRGGCRLRCRLAGGFARLLWCGWTASWLWAYPVPPPPPRLFFWGGGSACSSLCLPRAGARTGRHSVWLTGLLLVLAFCWALPRPHGSGGLCTRLARWPFLSG